MKKILLLLIICILFPDIAGAQTEVAVLPYEVINPSKEFPLKRGNEYARLIAIAAGVRKGIMATPPKLIDEILKKLKLNSQQKITEDDLKILGKELSAEYVLIGSISKTKSGLNASSLLYSYKDKGIISKSRVSGNRLTDLAVNDTREIFINYPDKKNSVNIKPFELTFIVDASYNTAEEWQPVKLAIKNIYDYISEKNYDTTVNIIPFSQKNRYSKELTGISTSAEISDKLNGIIPSGAGSSEALEQAVKYAVLDLCDRDKTKLLIIISNTADIRKKIPDKYALLAKKNRMSVYVIALGNIKRDNLEPYRTFAISANGSLLSVAYRQRLYNIDGKAFDIFTENGRLCETIASDNRWQNGLFESADEKSTWAKPKSFLSEIFYDEKKYNLSPYNMAKFYPLITRSNILNSDKTENNLKTLLGNIGETFIYRSGVKSLKTIGRVLISDGVSVWIKITDEHDLAFFREKLSTGKIFPLGVCVEQKSNEPYGLGFIPGEYVTGLTADYIPDIISTSIRNIIKTPEFYMTVGLLNPPVWFIYVKVISVEGGSGGKDIRDSLK